MSKRLLIVNGPNLNLLGLRDRTIYGEQTFESYLSDLTSHYRGVVDFAYEQSNVEGVLIDILHAAAGHYHGVILNAGGYTHTSVALADAVGAVGSMGLPTVEVHISNILSREEFRHTSLIAPRCAGSIMGFGLKSYALAVESFLMK